MSRSASRRGRTQPTARGVATQVLFRVAERGAWAAPALDAEIDRAKLDARDAALATEIVYGTLRALPAIDAQIARKLRKPDARLDGWARAALRGAVYQLACLDRVPTFAVVDETVRVVRDARDAKLGGFVNAILRAFVRVPESERAVIDAQRMELPPWLDEALVASLGSERSARFRSRHASPPPIGLRVRGDRDAFVETLRAAYPDADVSAGQLAPECVLVRGVGDPRRLPGYAEGAFAVQEQGAQVVAALVGATEGERVLDACAGHGTKSAYLAEQVGGSGRVIAVDVHQAKLDRMVPELERLGIELSRVERETIDLAVGDGGLEPGFDRVLVDAPCTGLGTIHRRPELLLRLGPRDVDRMAALQLSILRTAASLVRPGGMLVYAVCSPLDEEGAGVVEALTAERDDLQREAPSGAGLPSPDGDGMVRIGPWLGDADAYQVARLRRLD